MTSFGSYSGWVGLVIWISTKGSIVVSGFKNRRTRIYTVISFSLQRAKTLAYGSERVVFSPLPIQQKLCRFTLQILSIPSNLPLRGTMGDDSQGKVLSPHLFTRRGIKGFYLPFSDLPSLSLSLTIRLGRMAWDIDIKGCGSHGG